jgi:hypothetical protein
MAGVAALTVGPLLLAAGRSPLDSPSSSPNRSLLDLDFSDISAMAIPALLRSAIQFQTQVMTARRCVISSAVRSIDFEKKKKKRKLE